MRCAGVSPAQHIALDVSPEKYDSSYCRGGLAFAVRHGANQPPVASYTVTCSPGRCVLDGSSSTDDQGIVSYGWKVSVSGRAAELGPSTVDGL